MTTCGVLVVACGVCRQPLSECPDTCPGGEAITFRCGLEEEHPPPHAVDSRWARMARGEDG